MRKRRGTSTAINFNLPGRGTACGRESVNSPASVFFAEERRTFENEVQLVDGSSACVNQSLVRYVLHENARKKDAPHRTDAAAMDTFENRIGSPETRQGPGAVRSDRMKSPANFRGQGYGIRLPNVFVA